jgi:hypothetical protein
MSHIQQMQGAGFALSRKNVQILTFKLAQRLGIKRRFCVVKDRAGRLVCVVYETTSGNRSVRRAEVISPAELR